MGTTESYRSIFAWRKLDGDFVVRRLADDQRIKRYDRWATVYFSRISVALVYTEMKRPPLSIRNQSN